MYQVTANALCRSQTHAKLVKFNMQGRNVSMEKSEFKPVLFPSSPSFRSSRKEGSPPEVSPTSSLSQTALPGSPYAKHFK